MKHRTFGKTGAEISEVGLGTWQLGSADWGVVDDGEALAMLHKATELGVNLIDTADVYGMGLSEQRIGRFLRETRETVYVATKLGRRIWVENGWPKRFALDQIRKATEASLRNLGVDAIFLQQWHCLPTEMYRDGEVLDHLDTLKKEGLIQHWGCSVESVEEGLLCSAHPGCAALQVIYNIFRQKLTDELLPVCAERNVGILARVPLASGLLTGKITKDTTFPEKDHRHYNVGGSAFNAGETFAGLTQELGVECVDEIKKVLPQLAGATLSQWALRWILDHEAVSAVIPGATKLSQVRDNAGASELPPLTAEVHAALRRLYDERIADHIAGKY